MNEELLSEFVLDIIIGGVTLYGIVSFLFSLFNRFYVLWLLSIFWLVFKQPAHVYIARVVKSAFKIPEN